MFTKNSIKRNACAVLVVLAALSSCKKDDSPAVVTPPAAPQLISYSDAGGSTVFEYNADGTLKTVRLSNDPVSNASNVTYSVSYRSDKKIEALTGSNGTTIRLSYTNGLLSKTETFNGPGKIEQTDYGYNGTVLRSSTISLAANNALNAIFKGEFTQSNGNITKTNLFIYNPFTNRLEPGGHVNSQYDNKPNPLAALGDVALIFWQIAPKNNITRADYFDAAGSAEQVVETTYTYNAAGYPVSAAVKETQPGQQPVLSSITYTYR